MPFKKQGPQKLDAIKDNMDQTLDLQFDPNTPKRIDGSGGLFKQNPDEKITKNIGVLKVSNDRSNDRTSSLGNCTEANNITGIASMNNFRVSKVGEQS